MKEDDAVQEELNKAKDKSRHLERQLHDKDREVRHFLVIMNKTLKKSPIISWISTKVVYSFFLSKHITNRIKLQSHVNLNQISSTCAVICYCGRAVPIEMKDRSLLQNNTEAECKAQLRLLFFLSCLVMFLNK